MIRLLGSAAERRFIVPTATALRPLPFLTPGSAGVPGLLGVPASPGLSPLPLPPLLPLLPSLLAPPTCEGRSTLLFPFLPFLFPSLLPLPLPLPFPAATGSVASPPPQFTRRK